MLLCTAPWPRLTSAASARTAGATEDKATRYSIPAGGSHSSPPAPQVRRPPWQRCCLRARLICTAAYTWFYTIYLICTAAYLVCTAAYLQAAEIEKVAAAEQRLQQQGAKAEA